MGRILQILAPMFLVSILDAIVHGEFYAIPAFAGSAAPVAGLEIALARSCRSTRAAVKLEAMDAAAPSCPLKPPHTAAVR